MQILDPTGIQSKLLRVNELETDLETPTLFPHSHRTSLIDCGEESKTAAASIPYTSELTDKEWETTRRILPIQRKLGRPPRYYRRSVVSHVRSLIEDYQYVGMIGDGVNDAPALATASVGIAMGAIGNDMILKQQIWP